MEEKQSKLRNNVDSLASSIIDAMIMVEIGRDLLDMFDLDKLVKDPDICSIRNLKHMQKLRPPKIVLPAEPKQAMMHRMIPQRLSLTRIRRNSYQKAAT